MHFFVGITDRDWFDFLSRLGGTDEVNFWQPSGQQQFRALQIGEPFLFNLHSPNDYIVGRGFFSHFTILPASIVWKAFGQKNGARTEQEMRERIARYRRAANPQVADDYQIGCILLESPFFFDRTNWIPLPDWKREIVRGKGYDSDGDGKDIWQRIEPLSKELLPIAILSRCYLSAPISRKLGQLSPFAPFNLQKMLVQNQGRQFWRTRPQSKSFHPT